MIGNILYFVAEAFVRHIAFAPGDRLLVHDIDHALKLVFGPNGQENWIGISAQLFPHVVQRIFKVRAGTIHFVDKRDSRNAIFGGLTPNRLGLRLHAGYAAEYRDCAIEHPHRALDLSREIHMAGSVDNVDPMPHTGERFRKTLLFLLRPEAGHGGGSNGDSALALLLHPVRHRIAVIDVANLVNEASIKQNALRGSGLAGVDVRGNANIARALHGILPLGRIHRSHFFCCYCCHLI